VTSRILSRGAESWASIWVNSVRKGSATGASYGAGGAAANEGRHGVTAFSVNASGMLAASGSSIMLRSRPIHVTTDITGAHLLVAYNDPSGVSVHHIQGDGTIGAEVQPQSPLDSGIYAHHVRVLPSNKAVVLVTRGNGRPQAREKIRAR
jgi:6-phosphogluconolactonase